MKKVARMRILVFAIFYLINIYGFSQLDPAKEWFTLEGFFDIDKIQGADIKGVVIYKSDKKDDEAFNNERKLAQYYFNENGHLIESQNFVPLSRRIDTSSIEFNYKEDKLVRRVESQGPFKFSFSFVWLNDSTFLEIKIDENTLDTNYIHRIEIKKDSEYKEVFTFYNSIGRPMKSQWVERDLFNQKIYQKESYARSLSFEVDSFNYQAKQLLSRLIWNTIGKQKKTMYEFTYVDGYLDFIVLKEDGELSFKYALLYNEKKLVKSIVKRDVKEKSISIYKLEYQYFPTGR